MDLGSHVLFVGKVVDSDLLDPAAEPLTYAYYRDVKKGRAPKNAPTFSGVGHAIAEEAEKYTCSLCGYAYDPALGDPEQGILAGTPFEKLPPNWICPICQAGQSEFQKR
ncbi:MAG: rubredoxin [Spirochaetes bacterium]|nr:rubredoxin [Spirochaetota bacterium]